MVRVGSTGGQPWVEAVPTRDSSFAGRTFSRWHLVGGNGDAPNVAEIWATGDHDVSAHAHDVDEILYVLRGAIEVNGRTLTKNDVAFIPRGSSYRARVVTPEGSHVLRVEFPQPRERAAANEYGAKVWRGPLTAEGVPDVGDSDESEKR
jgi:mannose-6-phosphate isomerase-like protein (cupin superfamily)